jgi:NADH:ubiquinone oxidoreductase subunit E
MEKIVEKKTCQCAGKGRDLEEQLAEIIVTHKEKRGALIPVLQDTQNRFGYVPREALPLISKSLNEPLSRIYGVLTFYSFFSLKPRGKYLIRVCLGTACYVKGAEEVLTALKQQLKIGIGETTSDGLFTLEVGRCFGACGLAPVIMINEDVHQWVKSSNVERILKQYRKRATVPVKEAQ